MENKLLLKAQRKQFISQIYRSGRKKPRETLQDKPDNSSVVVSVFALLGHNFLKNSGSILCERRRRRRRRKRRKYK